MHIGLILAGECAFQYVRQPPSTITHNCNPYITANGIEISLQCIVRTKTSLSGTYEIRWFKENDTGTVNLGRQNPENYSSVSNTMHMYINTTSTYHFKQVTKRHHTSLAGKYWCQVINTTADPDQPLMRSNMFTLLPPEYYTGSGCSSWPFLQDNITCADLNDTTHTTTAITTNFTSYSGQFYTNTCQLHNILEEFK